jgi:peroxiredoxin
MRADIFPAATFPDYDLADHTGKHRKLSELRGPDPMVLVLGHSKRFVSLELDRAG